MPDPIGASAALQAVADAYRIFLQEMRNIRMEKLQLIRSIAARVDAERAAEARKNLNQPSYGER